LLHPLVGGESRRVFEFTGDERSQPTLKGLENKFGEKWMNQ
jgi:hypothetical protein